MIKISNLIALGLVLFMVLSYRFMDTEIATLINLLFFFIGIILFIIISHIQKVKKQQEETFTLKKEIEELKSRKV